MYIPEMAGYNVTKAALIALSETLMYELKPSNVGVSALCPTFFRTNLNESLRATEPKYAQIIEALFKRASMNAEQVAAAAIDGLEQGQPLIIPQSDGSWVYRLKRWSPALYRWTVNRQHASGALDKLAKPGVASRNTRNTTP